MCSITMQRSNFFMRSALGRPLFSVLKVGLSPQECSVARGECELLAIISIRH